MGVVDKFAPLRRKESIMASLVSHDDNKILPHQKSKALQRIYLVTSGMCEGQGLHADGGCINGSFLQKPKKSKKKRIRNHCQAARMLMPSLQRWTEETFKNSSCTRLSWGFELRYIPVFLRGGRLMNKQLSRAQLIFFVGFPDLKTGVLPRFSPIPPNRSSSSL